jgi:hypothetical protein
MTNPGAFAKRIIFFCLLIIAGGLLPNCSQPVLESAECIESRDSVKRFYSFHFGNDFKPTAESLAKRREYISSRLLTELESRANPNQDYFTQTEDYPKAFRVGKCETVDANRTKFEVLLFWRTNEQNIQREIAVETVKEENKWLIDKVLPKE